MPKVGGWTAFNVQFTVDGVEHNWQRFGASLDMAERSARRVLETEYGEMVNIIEVRPLTKAEFKRLEQGDTVIA